MDTRISGLSSETNPSSSHSNWQIVTFVSAAIGFAIWAIFFAPMRWQAAEQLKAEQIAQENRAVCEKLQILPGGDQFASCVASLTEVRQRHADRIAAEAAGMF